MIDPFANLKPPPDEPLVEPPDISHIEIEDDEPVDGIYSEKQQRLLTEPLFSSWSGPLDEEGGRRSFVAMANVGVFSSPAERPLVPDAMLSLDVAVNPDFAAEKRHNTYFVWEMGKPPDVVIEVVSNRKGGELKKRRRGYARMRVAYYVVWDPALIALSEELVGFRLSGDLYVTMSPLVFPNVGLELRPWEGTFEGVRARWLRWHLDGEPVPTGAERAEAERARAEAERERAESEHARAEAERERAERLLALLRQHGIEDPT